MGFWCCFLVVTSLYVTSFSSPGSSVVKQTKSFRIRTLRYFIEHIKNQQISTKTLPMNQFFQKHDPGRLTLWTWLDQRTTEDLVPPVDQL